MALPQHRLWQISSEISTDQQIKMRQAATALVVTRLSSFLELEYLKNVRVLSMETQ